MKQISIFFCLYFKSTSIKSNFYMLKFQNGKILEFYYYLEYYLATISGKILDTPESEETLISNAQFRIQSMFTPINHTLLFLILIVFKFMVPF